MPISRYVLPLLSIMLGCVHVQQPSLHQPAELATLEAVSAPLKIHTLAGTVYQLTEWQYLPADSVLEGTGALYGIDRQELTEGQFRIPLDSMALIETNSTEELHPFGIIGLVTTTVVWGAVTVACTADPKSCFGSCPTFYIDSISRDRPLAEGFSASFAHALEATDIDALNLVRPAGRHVTIRMANEAWETHAVRSVQLLAVPARHPDEVFATRDGHFYAVENLQAPTRCLGLAGDCRSALQARDSLEWRSPTDSSDLAAQETVELAFPAAQGSLGLVLGARQSFVSTFVLYQSMAYFGHEAGAWLAALERGDSAAVRAYRSVWGTIGRISVAVFDSSAGWHDVGTFDEAGPIATDVQVIPIGTVRSDTIRVRLTMARGSWRIDYAARARLSAERTATTLDAVAVAGERTMSDARRMPDYLITYPGDEYRFTYVLPREAESYALFLKSRGYYYEWMRGEWLAEQNPMLMAQFALDPRSALRTLAPGFKAAEHGFDQNFWASRFGRGTGRER